MIKLILGVILSTVLYSCSTQTCKPEEAIARKAQSANATAATTTDSQIGSKLDKKINMSNKKIKVYKLDGSKQCEQGTGVSAAEMAKELGSLKVLSSEKKHDGLMRIQVCGQPTGQCNVYEIFETDLSQAEKLGFKIWKND